MAIINSYVLFFDRVTARLEVHSRLKYLSHPFQSSFADLGKVKNVWIISKTYQLDKT